MKYLKITGIVIIIIWIIALIFTYNHSFFWYAYFIISAIAILLAGILLYQKEIMDFTNKNNSFMNRLRHASTKSLPYEEDDYYDIIVTKNNRRKKKRRKKRHSFEIGHVANRRKNTEDSRIIINESPSNIRNKEYLHTNIPSLYEGEAQKILFDTIQRLKQQSFFTSFYGNVTNEDLITKFDEYQNRNIFELYDHILPNTYAKLLYDPASDSNRIAIFLPNIDPSTPDDSLGFIAIEDSYKADMLLKKYSDIQVFPTILGGTYKRAYMNSQGEIKIIKDFISYNLTISLAFYNA